ncbi:MAG: hypothetical protein ABI772_00440 [Bacteroidota bacterium]
MNKIYKSILLLLTVLTVNVHAQTAGDVKVENDTVYLKGVPQVTCKAKVKNGMSLYVINSFDSVAQATLLLVDRDSVVGCTARFEKLLLKYEVLYTKTDISVIMESYIKNKVIVDGKIDSLGLVAYCNGKKIVLQPMRLKKKGEIPFNDSLLVKRAKDDMASQIFFSIENTQSASAKVSIGSPSSNRIKFLAPGQKSDDHARPGEKICLLDNNNKVVSCEEISQGLKSIQITKKGTLVRGE